MSTTTITIETEDGDYIGGLADRLQTELIAGRITGSTHAIVEDVVREMRDIAHRVAVAAANVPPPSEDPKDEATMPNKPDNDGDSQQGGISQLKEPGRKK